MPRKPTPLSNECPYHITARCVNREKFEIPLDTAWQIYEDYLWFVARAFDIKLHSFVLMPNHFHLLATAPNANLSQAMLYFMRETSREFSRQSGRINQTYGARFHRSLITSYHHFTNVYKYVYRNPVRARLVSRVEEYAYSTLSGLCGRSKLVLPVEFDEILFQPEFSQNTLDWLNRDPLVEHEDELRRALKHREFTLRTSRLTGKESWLQTHLL